MKKVMIISRHAISNYGSFLQAVALEKTVTVLGYDAYTLNYINKEEKSYHLCYVEIKDSPWNKNFFRRVIFYAFNIPNRAWQFHTFSGFRKNALHLSKEYNTLEGMRIDPPVADIYCTGSDQVWNETINDQLDWAYFLDFLPKGALRISYAASFGKDTFKVENAERIKSCLSKYISISVREQSGTEMLSRIGLSSEQVLDPTLLLSRDEWHSIRENEAAPKKKYILLYQIHKNESLVNYTRNYAQYLGCEVINVSVSYTEKKKGFKFTCLPSYKKLLALFESAYCIVTDSFHATAFSINLNKQFVTLLPKQSTSRNQSILQMFSLESRVINDETDFETPEVQIDYSPVNIILEQERCKSLAWLKNTLDRVANQNLENT